jgi:hypothetical protein
VVTGQQWLVLQGNRNWSHPIFRIAFFLHGFQKQRIVKLPLSRVIFQSMKEVFNLLWLHRCPSRCFTKRIEQKKTLSCKVGRFIKKKRKFKKNFMMPLLQEGMNKTGARGPQF